MNIKLKIGSRIKESRKNKSLTAVQLALKTGFSAQRISNWERGSRTPKFSDAEILGKVLDVSPTWLLFLDIDQTINNNNFQSIPIINSVSSIEGFLPIPLSVQAGICNNDFSIIIRDQSMFPLYNIGDIVTFSKVRNPKCDLVLIKIKASGDNLFRKICSDHNSITFSALNLDWPQTRFESESMYEILGWIKDGPKIFF